MTEISEKEQEILSLIESRDYHSINEVLESQEYVLFLVSSFSELTDETVQAFVLQSIFFWYNEKMGEISEELNNAMYQTLFTVCVERYSSYSIAIKRGISMAQVLCCFANYPGNDPNIWQTLFGFGAEILDPFLLAFSQETSRYSAVRIEIFSTLKQAMREQGVLPEIIKHCLELIATDPRLAVRILSKLANWCDLDFVNEEESMALIQGCLTNIQTTGPTLNLYETIIKRNSTDETIGSIIESLVNLEALGQIVEQSKESEEYSDEVHFAVGSIVNSIGIITSDGDYFTFAVETLLDASEVSAISVAPFICNFLSQQDPESYNFLEVFEIAYNHIVSFFNDDSMTPSMYTSHIKYPMAFADICISCWTLDSSACNEFVLSNLEGMNPLETPAIAAALSFLLLQMYNMSEIRGVLNDYVRTVIAITQVEQPYSAQDLSAFYIFSLMSEKFPDKMNNADAIRAMFDNFISIIGLEGMEEADRNLFIEAFARKVPSFAEKIDIGPEVAQPFFETMNPVFVHAGAAISQSQIKIRDERFHELYPVFVQAINENTENPEGLANAVKCALELVKTFTVSVKIPPEEGDEICEFLQQFCSGNDELLSLYLACTGNIYINNEGIDPGQLIEAPPTYQNLVKLLQVLASVYKGELTEEQVLAVFGAIMKPEYFSLIDSTVTPKAIFNLLDITYKLFSIHNNIGQIAEVFNAIMKFEFHAIISCFNVELALSRKFSKEVAYALKLFTDIAKNQFSFLDEEIKGEIFGFARRIYTHEIQDIFVLCQAETLILLFKQNAEVLFDVATACAMPVTFYSSIIVSPVDLVNTLKKHKKIMKCLIEEDREKASTIVQNLAEIGIDPEYAASFLINDEVKIKSDSAKQILYDMRKMFLTAGV